MSAVVLASKNRVVEWCAREDLNLQPFRDQILSLARLPFRHARNRHQVAPRVLKSQARF